MQRSENICELITAVNRFQSIMPIVSRRSNNPYHHSRYADLATIWEAIQKPLTECGLAVLQPSSTTDDKTGVRVETFLTHISGQWISDVLTVYPRPEKPKRDEGNLDQAPFISPQALGSAQTYARRYALCAMLGIVTDDDDGDGEAAEGRAGGNGNQKRTPPATPKPEEPREARNLKEAQMALNELDQATAPPAPVEERKALLDQISERMKALIRQDDPRKSAKQKALMSEAFGTDRWSAVFQMPLDALRAGLGKIGGNGQKDAGPAADIGF